MNGEEHIAIGIGVTVSVILAGELLGISSPEVFTIGKIGLVVCAGAIAPDIDHPSAFISSGLPRAFLKKFGNLLIVLTLLFAILALLAQDFNIFQIWIQNIAMKQLSLIAIVAIALMLLSSAMSSLFKHRGPTHSIVINFVVTILAALIFKVLYINWWYGLWFGLGWLSHILADSTTERGVSLWWPFSNQKVHLFRIR